MDREQLTEDLPVGGQAVIEGVMMRVPGKIVTAVRAADREIVVREEDYESITRRFRLLGLPVLRGAISFFEMMIIGLKALNFSADVAMQQEDGRQEGGEAGEVRDESLVARNEDMPKSGWKDQLALAGTMVFSVGMGVGLFFFLPLTVAQYFGLEKNALEFNLLAGGVRTVLLVLYLWVISRWREIQRVFQYHGAEHKSIFTLEAGADLTIDEARSFGRLHPRCGTSFMLIVVLFAIAVFACADSLFPLVFGHPQSLLERFATHFALLPLIAGISFELLKFSGKKRNHPLTRVLIAPGLWLQQITTREPDDDQLEVALVALRCVLGEESQAVQA
jgi:uncharacterized protein YqhQ|tara:strand:+ start:1015 stop:2016 length:1002 start_codon:yes stop_codon:yes gene_type:complete